MDKIYKTYKTIWMWVIIYIILFVVVFVVVIYQQTNEEITTRDSKQNTEMPQIKIYDVKNCQFITDKQEYWCMENEKKTQNRS